MHDPLQGAPAHGSHSWSDEAEAPGALTDEGDPAVRGVGRTQHEDFALARRVGVAASLMGSGGLGLRRVHGEGAGS